MHMIGARLGRVDGPVTRLWAKKNTGRNPETRRMKGGATSRRVSRERHMVRAGEKRES